MKRFWMILVLMLALGLVFTLAVQAKQEKTEEVKKEPAETACTACVVDARKCRGFNNVMYGVVSFREVWNSSKFTLQKVCVVKGDKPSVWSFEGRVAVVSEITTTQQKEAKQQKEVKPEKTSAAEEKLSRSIGKIEEAERAATKREIAAEEELMEEITGLIIEQTMTKIGYEFYENFFIRWEAPKGIKGYNIFIDERASPLWGSWIQIKVDTTMVWSKVLKPRSEEIEEAAKQAVEVTKGFLSRYEEYKRELEGPDMVGSGI
ncbi:hypothetical protein KJA13_02275 [Patescibacteria group bacterium]|nr:hypothetical protein [Patescibacteria group bacterium]